MELSPKWVRVVRLLCSLLALACSWLASAVYSAFNRWGSWHGIPFKDHIHLVWHDTRVWMFWTGIFCVIGWFLVGLPAVSLGDKVLSRPVWLVCLAAGLAGAAIPLVPTLVWTVGLGQAQALLHPWAWFLCGIAFAMAAATMLFYRSFLWLATRVLHQT